MATFTIDLNSPLASDEAWRRIWNLDAHTRLIPLTRLIGDGTGGEPLLVGSRFVARTGVGPVGFDDVMTVRSHEVPAAGRGRIEIEKSGKVVLGRIEAAVAPATGGSHLTWRQQIHLTGVPTTLDPVVAIVAKAAYTTVLKRLLATPVRE